jgi:hypothetical protein
MTNPADRFHISGLVKLEEEDIDGAIESFRASVLATHADDHVFMTRVQMFWMQLLAHGRDLDAFEFLVDVSARVARKDLEEFNELLLQSYREGHPQATGAAGTSA